MSEDGYTPLGRYILALIESQNLSMRKASLRSGLEAGTVAKILQRDGISVPTPDTLEKIAAGLDGDYYRMMQLAGHLPDSDNEDDEWDAAIYAMMMRLQDLIHEASKRDPEEAARLTGMMITSWEIMLATKEPEPLRREKEPKEELAHDGEKIP